MTTPPMPLDLVRRTETTRLLLLCLALVVGVLSASGLLSRALFSEPSPLKYTATVVLASYLAVLVGSRKPLRTMTVVMAAVAPFAATADLGGLRVTLGLLALAPAVLVHAVTRPARWRGVDVRRSSLAIAAPCAAAVLAVPLVRSSAPAQPAITLVAMIATGWLIAAVAKDATDRRWVAGGLVFGAAVQAALAVRESITGRPLNLYHQAGTYATDYFFRYGSDASGYSYRPSGGLPDPNSLGNILAVSCPLVLALALAVTDRRVRVVLAGLGVLDVVGLAATLSRMSWVAAALGLSVAVALLPARTMVRALCAVAAGCLPAVAVALAISGGSLAHRFATVLHPTANATASRPEDLTRIALWQASWAVAGQHPVAGVGLGNLPPYLIASVPNTTDATHAHSTYLNVAAEAGFAGALGVLFVMVSAGKDCARGLRGDRVFYAGTAGGLVTVLAVWTTDYTVRVVPVAMVFAVLIGLSAAASRRPLSR